MHSQGWNIFGVPPVVQPFKDPELSLHQSGFHPCPAQWVKDPVLPQLWHRLSCSLAQIQSLTWGTSICHGCGQKKKDEILYSSQFNTSLSLEMGYYFHYSNSIIFYLLLLTHHQIPYAFLNYSFPNSVINIEYSICRPITILYLCLVVIISTTWSVPHEPLFSFLFFFSLGRKNKCWHIYFCLDIIHLYWTGSVYKQHHKVLIILSWATKKFIIKSVQVPKLNLC